MKRGEIYKGEKLGHYFIFYGNIDGNGDQFLGCMLTHNGEFTDNVLMDKAHFEELDSKGEDYDFQFENTYLTCKKLIKQSDYGPFKLAGELTDIGISFIESKISLLPEEEFKTRRDKY